VSERLTELCREWNYSERVLKQHEGITDSAIIPSVNELRYSGRRLIEALDLILKSESEQKVLDLISDAIFDCHRARHDAIDASAVIMISYYNTARRDLDIEIIIKVFPKFTKCITDLYEVKKKIAEARENRHNRDFIYTEISREKSDQMINDFIEFRTSTPIILELMRKAENTKNELEKNEKIAIATAKRANKIALWSAVFGGLGILIGIVSLFK
jgi:hypothetical protein